MLEHIKNLVGRSEAPTWRELLADIAGAAAVFLIPVVFVLWAAAFGWGK